MRLELGMSVRLSSSFPTLGALLGPLAGTQVPRDSGRLYKVHWLQYCTTAVYSGSPEETGNQRLNPKHWVELQ